MCEVTKDNFKNKLPEIKRSLENSKFISVDLEFSALQPLQNQAPRLFDNNKERYKKLRLNLLEVIPLQVGITAFHFDTETNDYFGDVFTFYINPPAFGNINKAFYFKADTTSFLCLHNFDFNKFAYLGIPYLNLEEETRLKKELTTNDLIGETSHLQGEFNDAIKAYCPIISKWYNNCKIGDFLEIPDIFKKFKHYVEIIYFIHKHLRNRFKNLWTYEKNGSFFVKKVTEDEYNKLLKNCKLDEDVLFYLIGFRHVFDILKKLRKPIIGHNLLQDLMIMINNFEITLPESYSQFKLLTNELFPIIFDTKTLYYELRNTIPREKLPDGTGLETLFEYFKDGLGRHLILDCSAIQSNIEQKDMNTYHQAGWDSFCAGYIFIRMGYYNISQHYPKSKKFVSSEIIGGLSQYKNCINVIRGATAHIRIDGPDPSSNRPPWLIIESLKNEPLNVGDLMSALSSYGFVDIKKISPRGNRVLVAVDTYRAAREISKTFQANPKFHVKQYNILRHSPVARAFILGAVTISGTFLLWLTHSAMKR